MATNPDAAALKAKRADTRAAQAKADATPAAPPAIGQGRPARNELILFDPSTPLVVAQATGSLYGVEAGEQIEGFTIAPEDAFETFTPEHCTTPVSRTLWTKGQHVRNEDYEAYVAALAAKKQAASA